MKGNETHYSYFANTETRQVVIYFESTRFLVSLESEVQLTCWLAYVGCKFGLRL